MRKLLILVLLAFTSTTAHAAPFAFNEATCSISSENVVTLAIGDEKLESRVRAQLVMVGEPSPTPQLQLTFLTHEPLNATFEWPSIIHSKKNVKLFRPEIFDRVIQQQGKSFPMSRISAANQRAVFASTLTSMTALQDMVALFLSQNDFVVHAFTEEGDDWSGTFSLSMSDASFRQMAAKCFSQLTAKYLTAGGERTDLKIDGISDKNSLAALPYYWSEGYGLTPYTELQAITPLELKDKTIFAETDSEDVKRTKLATWIHTLHRKQLTLAELQATNNEPEFIAINTQLAEYYSLLDTTYSRFVVLTGEPSVGDGLIQQKIKEQETLKLALIDIETKIASAQQTLDPLLVEQTTTEAALSPFMEYLTNVDKMTEAQTARITEITALQTHLQKLLARHQAAAANELQNAPPEGPWSIEEIEKQDKEAAERLQKAQTLALLQQQVQTIVGDLNSLLEKASAQQIASMTYLKAVAQQRTVKTDLNKEETWLFQSQQVPKFTVASRDFFHALNNDAELEISTELAKAQTVDSSVVRDYKWEFDVHSNIYNRIESEFVNLTETSKRKGSLISALLCHPNVLKDEKNRKIPCLTVDDILDEKIVENFLSTLPPKDVDDLLGTVPRPWNQQHSKTQLLLSKYQSELSNPTARLQELVDSWGALRQIIWRWVTMQKKAKAFDACEDREHAATALFGSSTYSHEYYNKAIECERLEVQAHKARKQELLQTLASHQAMIQAAESAFELADQEYETASQNFINGAIAQLRDIPALSEQTDIFSKCLLPLENAENCVDAVDEISSGRLATAAQNEYMELVQALVSHIHNRMTVLGQENATVMTEIQRLEQERTDYVAANNVTPLLEKRATLKAQIKTSQQELVTLKATQDQKRTTLSFAEKDEGTFRAEAQALIAELTSTKEKITNALPALLPFCARILPYTNRLQSIDADLYMQMNINPPTQPKKYSSCQIPNLETYVPAPGTLEISSAPVR